MTAYKLVENNDGTICSLFADDFQKLKSVSYNRVQDYVLGVIESGDSYQEFYSNGKHSRLSTGQEYLEEEEYIRARYPR